MSKFITIKKILGKDVTFLQMTHLKDFGNFVNAYVYIGKADEKEDYQMQKPYVTYQNGRVLGIDTAHSWNEHQTYKLRYDDAIQQITNVIKFFYNKRGK